MKISPSKETKGLETNSCWWSEFVSEQDFEDYEKGPKLILLFAILSQCEKIGDKM